MSENGERALRRRRRGVPRRVAGDRLPAAVGCFSRGAQPEARASNAAPPAAP
jgi:hypothetical protein